MTEFVCGASRLAEPLCRETGSAIPLRQRDVVQAEAGSGRVAVLFTRLCFSLVAMLVDAATILAAMLASDFAYNEIVHDAGSVCVANIQIGLFAAILFVGSNLLRNSYSLADYLDLSGHARQVFSQWNLAFLAAATFGFLARVIEDTSRGTFLVFYVAGLCALFLGRAGLVHLMKRNAVAGSALAARVVIVGFAKDIDDFISMQQPEQQGMLVVARHTIAEDRAIRDTDLAEATTMIRRLMPDDIVIAVPWNRTDTIEACVTAFLRVPASIHLHLDPDSPLNRFGGANMGANGAISGFRLRGYAIGTLGSVLKRGSDIILSALALIMLAPVFLAIAVAIRLDSPGPVLFRQMRHGFNKEPFRILKFRSMKVAEDGPVVTQATADDPRITRVGRWLRRYNLDELPQLLNVLMGQMSLVGPRPHALVHDDAFEQNIVLYARRHNVKPGITGWAQVNGLRGETDTPEKISQRVHHDLYYIDHWSFVLDVWILFLTLFSRKAYRNAG